MKIGLIDVDGHSGFPNLALMKLSRYHKQKGDIVEWYDAMFNNGGYDIVYMSKVFTHTPDYYYPIDANEIIKGGTGYDIHKDLPKEIDCLQPDYSIYPQIDKKTAYGFLTRGCPNKCRWCIVPKKEGLIRPYMDVDDIAIEKRTNLVLMDNNVLASEYGILQLKKIIDRGYKVDFNQGLDARLVTPSVAELLAQVKWLQYIRFGCDTPKQIEHCNKAISLIRSFGYNGTFFLYTMLYGDISECYHRVSIWKEKKYEGKVKPHCQPELDFSHTHQNIPQWQKDMAHWANKKTCYFGVDFLDFEPRKGFKCKEYFK